MKRPTALLHSDPQRQAAVRRVRRHGGFTLVEMLVAMALTLIIILAVTQVFRLVGDNVLAGRAVQEMSGQLRSTSSQLQRDLEGLTVPARPWPQASSGLGYLEYSEGPSSDMNADADPYIDEEVRFDYLDGVNDITGAPPTSNTNTSLGDIDDIIAFTSRAQGSPFVGQVMGQLIDIPNTQLKRLVLDKNGPYWDPTLPDHTIITSQVAEIIWWLSWDDSNGDTVQGADEPYVLRRQVRLIRPDIVFPPPNPDPDADPVLDYLLSGNPLRLVSAFDLSISFFSGRPVANSLSDLTNRQNRFGHNPAGFPYPVDVALLVKKFDWSDTFAGLTYTSEDRSADIILTSVTAFNVRAFDPTVVVRTDGTNEALLPDDPGYVQVGVLDLGAQGGFVDLFYSRYLFPLPLPRAAAPASSDFFDTMHPRSQLNPLIPPFFATYDTWSLSYEQDGVDQDGSSVFDQGTNGFDDDGAFGVDDVGERETSPPYAVPLRGLQVQIRIIDNDTRQVRQMTVSSDFVPE